jgi:hypothetical protein
MLLQHQTKVCERNTLVGSMFDTGTCYRAYMAVDKALQRASGLATVSHAYDNTERLVY